MREVFDVNFRGSHAPKLKLEVESPKAGRKKIRLNVPLLQSRKMRFLLLALPRTRYGPVHLVAVNLNFTTG